MTPVFSLLVFGYPKTRGSAETSRRTLLGMRALERENAAFGGPGCKAGRRIRLLVSLSSLRSRVERERDGGSERPSSFLPRNHKFLYGFPPNLLSDFPRISSPFLVELIDSPARFSPQACGCCSIGACPW